VNHNTVLLLCAFAAVVGLIVLIAHFKLNAFVALVLASIFIGLCSAFNLPRAEAFLHLQGIGKAFADGVGNVLASIAMVVGLGTILGKLLAESGGAEVIARWLIGKLGTERLNWTMLLIAFLVGIPVWFTVGLVLLVPIMFTLVKETGKPVLHLGIPLLAGLSAAHTLVPPHPGPLAAIGILHADAGRTILFSLLVGLPTAIVAGPLFGRFITRRVEVAVGAIGDQLSKGTGHMREGANPPLPSPPLRGGEGEARRGSSPCDARRMLPGFGITVFTVLLPVMLMMAASAADLVLDKQSTARAAIDFIGNPTVAMLLAVIFSFYSFGAAIGFGKDDILKFTNDCLAPVGMVLLVVGAGGGFSKTLEYTGVGRAITEAVVGAQLSPILLGWFIGTLMRIAAGSATVAISTAAGIMAPIATAMPGTNLELLVLAMGAGSGIFSHLNDGGFWFVKEYFNMTVPQTLQTWSVLTTIKSVVALLLVLLLNAILK
jgi:GntP family gluconate:H+ symporter